MDSVPSQSRAIREHVLASIPEDMISTNRSQETLVPDEPNQRSTLATVSLTILLTLCASLDHLAATMFYPALPSVSRQFQVPKSVANLCSSLDFAGVAVTVLYWSAASQRYESKSVLLVCLWLVMVFTLVGSLAPSVGVLIAMQVLSSAAAAGTVITGVSIINRLWPPERKGLAMGLFFMGPQASPCLGPVIGGLLTQRWGWRALQHFQWAWATVMFIAVAVFLPRTSKGSTQDNRPRRVNLELGSYLRSCLAAISQLPRALLEPLHIFKLLQYLFVDLLLWQAAFSFAITSIFSVTLQSAYSESPYNFDALHIGLLYIPYAVACIIASLVGGRWSDKVMLRKGMARHDHLESGKQVLVPVPEDRFGLNSWASFGLVPVALVAFGWALWRQPLWVFPLLPSIIIGLSAGMNLGLTTTVLVELIPAQAVGLMALSSIARNICAAVSGSVTQPLLESIGSSWLFTALGCVSAVNLGLMFWMQRRGRRWREHIWHVTKSQI